MTKTQYYVASSLDGFIADRDGSLDWLLAFGFEEFDTNYRSFVEEVGAVVMGAATYEWLLAQGPEAWDYTVPAWVLTHRELPAIAGADIRFSAQSVAELHPELVAAAAAKNVWVVGGGAVAAQFADAGLLDELQLTVMPVLLGSGTPLVPLTQQTSLTLTGTTRYDSGAIELRYELT